jgi:GNAT superfamily N-acetyltransferase
MPPYHVRAATLGDVDALAHHRLAMFTEMGSSIDAEAVDEAFRRWLAELMPVGTYRAWVVETDGHEIVAGGGITVLPWPPGPQYLGGRLAFAYNVYTEPAHRRCGLARMIMDAIHAWCRSSGIGIVGLNASTFGQSLYETLGYQPASSPMMVLALELSRDDHDERV